MLQALTSRQHKLAAWNHRAPGVIDMCVICAKEPDTTRPLDANTILITPPNFAMVKYSLMQGKACRLLTIGYVLLLHIFLVVLIVKTDFLPKIKVRLGIGNVNSKLHVSSMLRYHQQMDDLVPDNAIIFLGDSITQGLATAAVAPYSINYGIGGENTIQLLTAIPSYKSLKRAGIIVLAIGINDFLRADAKSG